MWSTNDKKAIKFLNRATVLGLNIEEIEIEQDNKKSYAYLIKKDSNEHILHIPNEVEKVDFSDKLSELRGILRVIGGESLTNLDLLFIRLRLKLLDLSKLDTSNCISMRDTFIHSNIEKIIFGNNWNTSKVKNMHRMFSNFNNQNFISHKRELSIDLDLSNWDISNVEDLSGMFMFSVINTLNISGWNLKKNANVSEMFNSMQINTLDLSSLKLRESVIDDKNNRLRFIGSDVKEVFISSEDYHSNYIKEHLDRISSAVKIIVV